MKLVYHQHMDHRGTDKAAKFIDPVTLQDVWIPRSVIKHVSRDPLPDGTRHFRCVVEVEDWWADKNEIS